MADPLLEASNIETFYGPIMAIRGVSFVVPRGGIVTILGANGAGKTTILRTVSGVMDPQKGSVTFEGQPIHGLDPDKVMRRGLVHVPEGREVFPLLTVRENLRMGAFTRHDAAGIAADLESVFEYFPVLRARAEQRAGSLSGGEQQMLAISRALMARPKMMLLDEPSLGLAPRLVKEIFEIIGRINRERGVTVLLVEQNANMALQPGRLRLRPRGGPHRHGRHLRAPAREGGHQGVLPGGEGHGRAGHPPLEAEEDMALIHGQDTLPTLFRHVVRERGDKVAMREKTLGIWRAISWREYGERARHVGLGLVALGLRPGDVVSIIAENRPEWLYADLGTMTVAGVTNGIYTTDSARQVEYIVNDSGSRFFFAENEEQLDKILEVRTQLPAAREDRRLRHGRPPRLPGRAGDVLRGPPRARRALRPRASRRLGRDGGDRRSLMIWPFSCTRQERPVPRRGRC